MLLKLSLIASRCSLGGWGGGRQEETNQNKQEDLRPESQDLTSVKVRREGPGLRTVPPDTDVFLQRVNYGEKVDLSKGFWNPKRKMWVTTHFLEIVNQP